jgi:hypothetical protein
MVWDLWRFWLVSGWGSDWLFVLLLLMAKQNQRDELKAR